MSKSGKNQAPPTLRQLRDHLTARHRLPEGLVVTGILDADGTAPASAATSGTGPNHDTGDRIIGIGAGADDARQAPLVSAGERWYRALADLDEKLERTFSDGGEVDTITGGGEGADWEAPHPAALVHDETRGGKHPRHGR